QHPPHTAIAIRVTNSRHVRMKIDEAVAKADDRHGISNKPLAIERAQDLAASMGCHNKHRRRFDFQLFLTPNLTLQINAEVKLFQARAFPDHDIFAHFLCGASPANPAEVSFSFRFAVSQSASISALGTPSNVDPLSLANCSIARNLLANLAFAFFRAISGSTCTNRARLTAANSKSPISSSTFACSFLPSARRSSVPSSRIFSKIPSTSSQSKPIRA